MGCLGDANHAQTGHAPGICKNSRCKRPLCADCCTRCIAGHCFSCKPSATLVDQKTGRDLDYHVNPGATTPSLQHHDPITSPVSDPEEQQTNPVSAVPHHDPSQSAGPGAAQHHRRPSVRARSRSRARSRFRASAAPPGPVEWVPVSEIQFSQDSIAERFGDGKPLAQLIEELRSGALSVEDGTGSQNKHFPREATRSRWGRVFSQYLKCLEEKAIYAYSCYGGGGA